MPDETAVQEKPDETPPAAAPAADDPFSTFSLDHIAEDQRETYGKWIEDIKGRFSKFSELEEPAKLYNELAGLEGFDDFLNDPEAHSFSELMQARKELAALKAQGGAASPKPAVPQSTNGNGFTVPKEEWEQTQAELNQIRAERAEQAANQQFATLLNTYPEAKELLKDRAINQEMIRLTKTDPNTGRPMNSLEAAYAMATRQAYADMKLKGSEAKPPQQPETGARPNSTPNKKPRTLDEILEANFAKMEGVSQED